MNIKNKINKSPLKPDSTSVPLCIDLDYTLVHSDLLLESFFYNLKNHFFIAITSIFKLLNSRAAFKAELAKNFLIDLEHLPYNNEVIEFAKSEKAQNRKVILTTASNSELASQIVEKFNFLDSFYASSKEVNLKGEKKAKFLCEKFGENAFDYIGDSKADLKVWKKASYAHVVGNDFSNLNNLGKRFSSPSLSFEIVCQTLGVKHYWKIACLFLALSPFFSSLFNSQGDWSQSVFASILIAFSSLCLLFSFVYIFKDLLNLHPNRLDPIKKLKAISLGTIKLHSAVKLSLCCLFLGLLLAVAINFNFLLLWLAGLFFSVLYLLF